jgi:hypothetical protein
VHKENPTSESQLPTPKGPLDLGDDCEYFPFSFVIALFCRHEHKGYVSSKSATTDCLLKGTISHGLDLLYTVCCTVKGHEHLVSTMQMSAGYRRGFFLEDDALGDMTQDRRRRERLFDRDEKQPRGDPMPFRGDGETNERGPRPPLAWTLMWSGNCSNVYGGYVPGNIRRWGYVMWDAARLGQTSAKDDLLQK